MPLFIVRHQHDAARCPAADPYHAAQLLNHLSRPNLRKHGLSMKGEAVARGEHTLYMIIEAGHETLVRDYMAPFDMAGSLDVYPASTCAGVASRGGCDVHLLPFDTPAPVLDPEEACQQAIDDGLIVHRAHPAGHEELRMPLGIILRSTADLASIAVGSGFLMSTDAYAFTLAGIPGIAPFQDSPQYAMIAHSAADTLDKVEIRILRYDSAVLVALALGAADCPARLGLSGRRKRQNENCSRTGSRNQMNRHGAIRGGDPSRSSGQRRHAAQFLAWLPSRCGRSGREVSEFRDAEKFGAT